MDFQPEKESWPSYSERLEFYFKANKVIEDEEKITTLILENDPSFYELLRELSFPIDPKQLKYNDVIDTLKRYYVGVKNVFQERKLFYRAKKGPSETASEWYRRLKSLAIDCEFEEFFEDTLKDIFVCGFKEKIFQCLCEEDVNISLQDALKIAQWHEKSLEVLDLQEPIETKSRSSSEDRQIKVIENEEQVIQEDDEEQAFEADDLEQYFEEDDQDQAVLEARQFEREDDEEQAFEADDLEQDFEEDDDQEQAHQDNDQEKNLQEDGRISTLNPQEADINQQEDPESSELSNVLQKQQQQLEQDNTYIFCKRFPTYIYPPQRRHQRKVYQNNIQKQKPNQAISQQNPGHKQVQQTVKQPHQQQSQAQRSMNNQQKQQSHHQNKQNQPAKQQHQSLQRPMSNHPKQQGHQQQQPAKQQQTSVQRSMNNQQKQCHQQHQSTKQQHQQQKPVQRPTSNQPKQQVHQKNQLATQKQLSVQRPANNQQKHQSHQQHQPAKQQQQSAQPSMTNQQKQPQKVQIILRQETKQQHRATKQGSTQNINIFIS